MKTVHTTLDEPLVRQVDEAAQALGISRAGFVRDAVVLAMRQYSAWRERDAHSPGLASDAGVEGHRLTRTEAAEEVLREHSVAWEELACL